MLSRVVGSHFRANSTPITSPLPDHLQMDTLGFVCLYSCMQGCSEHGKVGVSMRGWQNSCWGFSQNRIVGVYDGSTVDFLRSLQALFPDGSANLILFICNVKLIPLLPEGPFAQRLNKARVHSACAQVLKIINFVTGDFCVSSWLC